MNGSESSFEAVVKRIYSYLLSSGFRIDEQFIETNALYKTVPFVGEHVAIVFSQDFKENAYDCYVGKVLEGRIAVDRGTGGYWSPLHKYLMDYCGYRGGVKLSPIVVQGEPLELHKYDAMLRQYGARLLADSADAFDKQP
jgi:hypothetical protein